MIAFEIPIRTTTGLNAREHWKIRSLRQNMEKLATLAAFPRRAEVRLPVEVTITRVSPTTTPMDDDNLPGATKSIRDQIAKLLGVDDGDRSRIRFRYEQTRGPWGVRVEIREEQKP